MKIFVSYSFREENRWVEEFVIPLITCFGHDPVTGRILDGGPLDEEVQRKIRQCKRVLCFVTRANPRYDDKGQIAAYDPPDWVRDELFLSRGAERDALEFREKGVSYGGAAVLRPYQEFDRSNLPGLLLNLAERLKDWPVGPLQLRLSVPPELRSQVEAAALARTLRAKCTAVDNQGVERSSQELEVRVRDGQLIVLFWIKADPHLAIDIDVFLGPQVLTCQGVSPIVRDAALRLRGM